MRRAVVMAIAAVSTLSACTPAPPPDVTGVSDDLVHDSITFRTAHGLFRMPEAPAPPGSALATAELIDVFGTSSGAVVDWKRAAASARPASFEAVDIAAYLRISRAAGIAPPTGLVAAMAAHLRASPLQGDVGAEVGALFVAADASSQLAMLGHRVQPPATVVARVKRIDPKTLDDSPYLVSRLAQTYAMWGLTPPAELTHRVEALGDRPFPSLSSLKGVLDASAIVAARGPQAANTWPADAAPTLLRILSHGQELDSLSRASALKLLILMGHRSEAATYITALRRSVDPATGLVRSTDADGGSVTATYLFSRLLDLRFGETATPATKGALVRAASQASLPLSARLMAAAALKRAGDDRWRQFSQLALAASRSQPSVIAQSDLATYVATMKPAADVNPDIPKSTFAPFAVARGDEIGQRDALAVMNNSYLFANAEALATSFPQLQSKLQSWMQSPTVPPATRIAAASALTDARLARVPVSLVEAFAAQLRSTRGCTEARSFLSTDGKESSPCSLVLTLQAKAIPGFS